MTPFMNNNYDYKQKYECWLNTGKAFLKCQRTMNSLLSKLDITIAQHELLQTIYRKQGATQKEVSEQLLVVKSNVSNHIKNLQQRGLVKTSHCKTDLRNKNLILTAKGERLVKRSAEIQRKIITTMMKDMKQSDILATNRLMLTAMESLDEIT